MIVVSDTSPLHYLILIGQDGLLPKLFGQVIVPPAILVELSHPRAPQPVQQWAARPPAWLDVRKPACTQEDARLGPGETEAISLAKELHADLLLIDERRGTMIARELSLRVIGILGILELASARQWVSLPDAIRELQQTTCRLSQAVVDEALARDRVRRQSRG